MAKQVEIKLTGTIEDFARIDNVYTSLKREGSKLLKDWKMEINVSFSESETPETEP